MVSPALSHTSAFWTNAAGIAGIIFAIGFFLSPIPAFRRIIRNKSTEQFSGLPYICALLTCLLCAWYGIPPMSYGNVLVITVNSAGAVCQLTYITLFIVYTERAQKSLVIQTRSVEFMPFYLSLSIFSVNKVFFLYGILRSDPFIYVPNGIGMVLGIVQLALFYYYRNISKRDSGELLLQNPLEGEMLTS
ncbi:hypothetical protein NMG60_11036894 [Bertholletia excelsa]